MPERLHTYELGITGFGVITWHCFEIVNILNIRWQSHRFCDIDFKEVVRWSLIVRSDSCDWRCGRISCWAGFSEKHRQWDEHLSRQQWLKVGAGFSTCSCLKIASRWQSVNQCESTTTATSSEDSGSTELHASSWDNWKVRPFIVLPPKLLYYIVYSSMHCLVVPFANFGCA